MATLTNSFEGGSAGTTVTTGNSGGTSGDAWTLTASVAGGTYTFSGTGAAHGALAGAVTTAGTGGAERRGWSVNAGDTPGVQFFRFYIDPANITGTVSPLRGMNVGSGGQRFRIQVTAAGVVTLHNGANTAIWTSSALAAGTQWRIEASVTGSTSGDARVRIYAADATTTSQDSGVLAAQAFGGPIREVWFGQTNAATNVALKLDDVGWSDVDWLGPAVAASPSVGAGPVAGALTDTGFGVGYWLDNSAGLNARLVVSTNSGLTSPVYSSAVVPDANGVVKLAITGLAANTAYFYGVEVAGTLLAGGRGQITTDPTPGTPFSFSVGFGSCQYDSPTAVTFTAMRDRVGPHGAFRRIIHMGDINYMDPDGTDTVATVLAQHRTSIGSASMGPLLARVGLTYAWDNHDYGGTDSDKNSAARPVVAAAMRAIFPSYTLPATDGVGGWFTYVLGRVRFIQLDTRSQRDPRTDTNSPSKTMLGTEQKAWLKGLLQGPEPLKVIQGNMYWRQDSSTGDRWGSYPDEFDELNDFIDTSAEGEVIVLFGDRHALAGDNGTSAGTRGRWQVGGAPFQQGSTASSETWSAGYYDESPDTMQAYGALDITDAGSTLTVDYSGITALDGVVRVTQQLVLELDATVAPAGIPTGGAVGTPSVAPGAVSVAPVGVGSGAAFGTPSVSPGAVNVAPASVPTGASVGVPAFAPGEAGLAPAGVPSGAAVGVPTLVLGEAGIVAAGIPSAASFGVPVVSAGAVAVLPAGIPGELSFGTPTFAVGGATIAPEGIPGGSATGTPTVTLGAAPDQSVAPAGIPSAAKLGVPWLIDGDLGQIINAAGIPSAGAVGRPIVTRMGEDRQMAPCLWDADLGCNTAEFAAMPPDLQARAIAWATEMLWMLSGRRFGTCPVTVRPCQSCGEHTYQTYGVMEQGGSGGGWVPYLMDGQWRNCGCAGPHSCRPASEVYLPGPVAGISEVRVDGVVVPANLYRVDDSAWLVRQDGQRWPDWQDLSAAPGAVNTFVVTYLRGVTVPMAGRIAAGALAHEFAKACQGGPCRLPQQVQSIVRQGVEMQLVAEDAAEMLTGVSEADQWIRAVNPSKLRQRPRVASLDVTLPRVQTWG